MRLALLTADVENLHPNLGDFFITHGLESYLSEHEIIRVPMHGLSNSAVVLDELKLCDALIICGTELSGAHGSSLFSLHLEQLYQVGIPVIPVGLGCTPNSNSTPNINQKGIELLELCYQSSGAISVRDETTFDLVESILGKESAVLTGCPSLLLSNKNKEPIFRRPAFSPSCYHYRPSTLSLSRYRRMISQLYREWSSKEDVLYLAEEPDDFLFENAAWPGSLSLYSPMAPAMHVEAIASSKELLSLRILPCLVALAHGVKTYLVVVDERTKSLAESMGLPYEVLRQTSSSRDVIDNFKNAMSCYPWGEINSRIDEKRTLLQTHLKSKGIQKNDFLHSKNDDSVRSYVVPQKGFSYVTKLFDKESYLKICVIVDDEYLGSLMGLLKNLHDLGVQNLLCHCLVLFGEARQILQDRFSNVTFHFWSLESLWSSGKANALYTRSRKEQAYASKAKLLHKAFESCPGTWFFLDCDLYFFSSPSEIRCSSSVLLFPHYNDTKKHSRTHGLFNSGLIRISHGSESFLYWWSKCSFKNSSVNIEESQFYEQGYLDLAPVLFKEVEIYRGLDENIGPWCINSLQVKVPPSKPWVPLVLDKPIRSYHASYPDPLGLFEIKAVRDQLATFYSKDFHRVYSKNIYYCVVKQQSRYWHLLRRGIFINEFLSQRLRMRWFSMHLSWLYWIVYWPLRSVINFTGGFYGRLRAAKRKIMKIYLDSKVTPYDSAWVSLQYKALNKNC